MTPRRRVSDVLLAALFGAALPAAGCAAQAQTVRDATPDAPDGSDHASPSVPWWQGGPGTEPPGAGPGQPSHPERDRDPSSPADRDPGTEDQETERPRDDEPEDTDQDEERETPPEVVDPRRPAPRDDLRVIPAYGLPPDPGLRPR